jgi:hypothetical protein
MPGFLFARMSAVCCLREDSRKRCHILRVMPGLDLGIHDDSLHVMD